MARRDQSGAGPGRAQRDDRGAVGRGHVRVDDVDRGALPTDGPRDLERGDGWCERDVRVAESRRHAFLRAAHHRHAVTRLGLGDREPQDELLDAGEAVGTDRV